MEGTRRGHGRRRRAIAVLGTLTLLVAGTRVHAADEAAGRIERIELKPDGAVTKVIVWLSRPIAFDVRVLDGDAAAKSGRRLLLDFADTTIAPAATKPIEVANDDLRQVRTGQFNARTARIVLELADDVKHSVDAFESPPHVTIALGAATAGSPATGSLQAPPPAVGVEDSSAAPPPAAEAKPSDVPPPAAATTTSDAAKPTVRPIPIRARGRRPFSLNYAR